MGVAMNPVIVLKKRTVDAKTSDQKSHRQDGAECQPISLLSFLEAENIRLRQAFLELSRDTLALREALKRKGQASASRSSGRGIGGEAGFGPGL
jgi:hypothetical protein